MTAISSCPIQNVVWYAKACTIDFADGFTCERTADIVSDMQCSAFLGSISLSSYTKYIRVAKLPVTRPFVLLLLVSLSVPMSDVVDLEKKEDDNVVRASYKCSSQGQLLRS